MTEYKSALSSRVLGQRRVALDLLGRLGPHFRRDADLPARIAKSLSADRRFGSSDRRLYRGLIYAAVRYLPWVEPLIDACGEEAIRVLAWLSTDESASPGFRDALLADWPPCPAGAAEKSSALARLIARPPSRRGAVEADFDPVRLLPPWLSDECAEALEPTRMDSLLSRSPLWLRIATGNPEALAEFEARGWTCRPSPLLPSAVRVVESADVTATDAYRRGQFEIQDLGSQLVLESIGIEPGGRWLDACAGAGGKSLQLAGILGPEGRVEARDPRPDALLELRRRAERAGLSERIVADFGYAQGSFDGVLLDVPCSGSGTWRRSPHLKWVTTSETIANAARLQRNLLEQYAPLVRPGGLLVYATCSLCRSENEENVEEFLRAHPEFKPRLPSRPFTGLRRGPGLLFLPPDHDGDGFFVASLERN